MNKLRFGTLFLIIAIILSSFSVPVVFAIKPDYVYNPATKGGVYDSFTAFESLIEGNDSLAGPWSAKVLRGDGNLTTFANFKGVATLTGTESMNVAVTNNVYSFGPKASATIAAYGSAGWDDTNNKVSNEANFKSYATMSKYWMRTNNGTTKTPTNVSEETSIAKVFTAPSSGSIRITAEDMNKAAKIWGRRANSTETSGAMIYIVKTAADATAPAADDFMNDKNYTAGNETYIYKYKFTFTDKKTTWYAQSVDFEPITIDVAEGEKLWFIANADDTAGGQYTGNNKFVHWNPVITYKVDSLVEPDLTNPVSKDQEFVVLIDAENVQKIDAKNIVVSPSDNGEGVKSLVQDGSTLKLTFDNIKSLTDYSVLIDGINTNDGYFCTEFDFSTEYFYDYPIYKSADAWPDETFADMKNNDPVWKWLYRNVTDTESLTNTYKYYEVVGQNDTTNDYSKPALVNGKYDYAVNSSNDDKYQTYVFADSKANPGRRNAMGKYWMRLSTADASAPFKHTYNRMVKEFTAPESGMITITAEDLNGDSKIYNKNTSNQKANGVVVKIVRESDSEKALWKHEFKDIESKAVAVYEFKAMTIEVTAGEKIWFVVSGELTANGYSQMASWDPVVTYTEIVPSIDELQPAADNNKDVALNFEHKLTFNHPIQKITDVSVKIDNGATVKTLSFDNEDKTLILTFDGLKAYTEYKVVVEDIAMAEIPNGGTTGYEYTFTTGSAIQIDSDIYLEGGSLQTGKNTVCIDVNNASKEEYSAVLLAMVCKGSSTDYEVVNVKYNNQIIGENDTVKVSVDGVEKGCFIKAVFLKDLPSAVALTDMKVFNAN